MNIDKINLDTELYKLKESIDAVTNGWFYKQQTALGITNGDLGFYLTSAYEKALDEFIDICKQGLEFQYEHLLSKETTITYRVNMYGECFFYVDGIEFEVYELCNVHKDTDGDARTSSMYSLICLTDDGYVHQVPDSLTCISDSSELDEGKPVHETLLNAAKAYVKEVREAVI